MRVRVEANSLKIGVDGAVTEAIKTGNWGVRLTFTNEQHNSRFEAAISREEALMLINDLQKSLESIEEVRRITTGK